jgi:outer membrane protein OmpA-like peptidoglycan-associated protein
MKTRLNVSLATAAIALLLLAGCVPTKKYKGSQAELSRVRNDSARLAQQVSSLNTNVQDLQNKNSNLQRSLDTTSSNYASQQRSLGYYQNYFKDQQNTLSQVGDDVKGALTQAGASNADVQMMDNAVYVSLDEGELFRNNSTAVTPNGKKVLDNLAGVIKSRENVNVFVSRGDSSAGGMAMASDNTSGGNTAGNGNMSGNDNKSTGTPTHHRTVHHRSHAMAVNASSGSASSSSSGSASATVHHRVHHHYSPEGSMAIYNGDDRRHNRAWSLQQARMVTVANHFLQNGVPKVNVSLRQPGNSGNTTDKNIRVIIRPKMNDFNPPSNSSVSALNQ